MSNRAAVSFLSSISLGKGQSLKKEPTQTNLSTQPPIQPQQSQQQPQPQQHHSHREHFKAKLTNHLEKKHLIHRHDKQPAPAPSPVVPAPSSSSSSSSTSASASASSSSSSIPSSSTSSYSISTSSSSQKPAIHPTSLKRSNSSVTMGNEYTSSSTVVIRSTSGTIPTTRGDREPSPRDKSPRDQENYPNKSRNNSVDHGSSSKRENQSDDFGIVRRTSDAGVPGGGKGRTQSTDQGPYKSRSESMDNGPREIRRKSTNSETSSKNLVSLDERLRQESPSAFGSKEYKKLSKSTSDASRSSSSSSLISNSVSNPSLSSSSNRTIASSSHKNSSKRDDKENKDKMQKSPSSKAVSQNKGKDGSSPLKLSKSNLHDTQEIEGPLIVKRQRRKKSKKSKGDKKSKKPVKQNPAALDFLKGISLGENTPTLRHRKSFIGKSKLSESYPSKSAPDAPHVTDNILFAGSASTKKIKIGEYASHPAGKIYLSTRSSSTFGVFSLIKYDSKANKKDKEHKHALKESLVASTIKSKSTPIVPNTKSDSEEEKDEEYDPYYLDDPSLTTGKHRTVMNLACFKESIIPYVKAGVIKDELNELFKLKHPWVPSGVTLHKIRKLKKELVHIAVTGGLEISTIAVAYVLFERLIIKRLITKPLIRLYGCVCLILAAKANDPRGDELKSTIEAIEKQVDVEKEELLENEFAAFHALSYNVHPLPEHVIPHIRLIIKDHQDLVGNPY